MLDVLDKIKQFFGSPKTGKWNGDVVGEGHILHRVGLELKYTKIILLQVLFN